MQLNGMPQNQYSIRSELIKRQGVFSRGRSFCMPALHGHLKGIVIMANLMDCERKEHLLDIVFSFQRVPRTPRENNIVKAFQDKTLSVHWPQDK